MTPPAPSLSHPQPPFPGFDGIYLDKPYIKLILLLFSLSLSFFLSFFLFLSFSFFFLFFSLVCLWCLIYSYRVNRTHCTVVLNTYITYWFVPWSMPILQPLNFAFFCHYSYHITRPELLWPLNCRGTLRFDSFVFSFLLCETDTKNENKST